MSTSVTLLERPWCQVCESELAHYDAKTVMGPWAYLCAKCWATYGATYPTVGTGMAQRIEVKSEDN